MIVYSVTYNEDAMLGCSIDYVKGRIYPWNCAEEVDIYIYPTVDMDSCCT